jgi:hypothetical protein
MSETGSASGQVSVDVRSRTAAQVRTVDASAFLGHELPDLAAERAELIAAGTRELAPRSLALAVEGSSWVLSFDGDRMAVTPGEHDEAGRPPAALVRLDAEMLADLVNDLRSPMGLFTAGDLDQPAGRLEDLLDWWVILRALVDERPVYTAGSVHFAALDGSPLDLHRSFERHDDRAEMSHFLAEAGYLHLRGVFSPEEMAAVSADMDAAADRYAPGDDNSWWARTADGTDRLVRMQRFQRESAATQELLADPRLVGLGGPDGLTRDSHRLGKPGTDANLVEALVKPIGVVAGISDVPWHKDCSLGSHSYRCCSMTVGISVTGADAGSGQLGVVAGSHRALIQPAFVRRNLDLPQIELPTETGDVTIHLSCTLHMSHPPVDRERRVLYTDFSLPSPDGARSPGEAELARIRKAAPVTVSQQPAR